VEEDGALMIQVATIFEAIVIMAIGLVIVVGGLSLLTRWLEGNWFN
jgi:hypothetical protein